jgi:hypothetical protein
MTSDIQEDAVEQAFWDFDADRVRTGAERDAFKHQARRLLRQHMRPLQALLAETDIYLLAMVSGFDPPVRQGGVRAVRHQILTLLEAYWRDTGEENTP